MIQKKKAPSVLDGVLDLLKSFESAQVSDAGG